MVAPRLAYSARSVPIQLPIGRWLRRAWAFYWTAVRSHMADRYGVPRPPRLH